VPENYWIEQYKNIRKLVEEEKIGKICYEDCRVVSRVHRFMNFHYRNLFKLIGGIELIIDEFGIYGERIENSWIAKMKVEEKVPGLIREKQPRDKSIRHSKGKLSWVFQGQILNEHEKDTVLFFWYWLVHKNKRKWPWGEKVVEKNS
jgi:hypothetical protein